MSLQRLRREAAFGAGLVRRRPFDVLVQVTNRCNMRCDFCAFRSNPAHPADELSVDDCREVEARLAAIGRFIVSIEGGEPLLGKDIVEIVRVVGPRHFALLYTNGWYVDARTAGRQTFNIDHLGNVAPCIEKIGEPVGNVRETSLLELVERLRSGPGVGNCQDCWTLCRGMGQAMGGGGSLSSWWDMSTRTRSR